MDKAVLVTGSLSPDMVEAGANVIRLLDQSKFIVDAAFWFYLPDSAQWRLVLASPKVATSGPKHAYGQVQSVLAQMPDPRLSLADVAVVDSDDPLVVLLRRLIRTEMEISGIRLTRSTVNGVLIEDAHIYRLLGAADSP